MDLMQSKSTGVELIDATARVTVVSETQIVEICGALKNIVACAAGFCDGLKMGDNTKAATIRLGMKEMMKYGDTFYPGGNPSTYFESCGVADLITTCYGGRNRKVSEVCSTGINKLIGNILYQILGDSKNNWDSPKINV